MNIDSRIESLVRKLVAIDEQRRKIVRELLFLLKLDNGREKP